MDHRRQFVTFVVMLGFFLVWINVAPTLFPQWFPKPQPKKPAPAVAQQDDKPQPGEVEAPPEAAVKDAPAEGAAEPAAERQAPPAEEEPETLQEFPARTITLGDASRGYLQQLEVTSRGASILRQVLTEYESEDRQGRVQLLGNNERTQLRTLAVESPAFDAPLDRYGRSLADVHWEFDEAASEKILESDGWKKAVFRYPSPDGKWEAIKTFSIQPAGEVSSEEDPTGYLVDVALTFRNLSDEAAKLSYDLQGPVGLPLENAENTQIYREVEGGTLEDEAPDDVTHVSMTAGALVEEVADAVANQEKRPAWTYPIRWAGVDVQYFAALLIPAENQLQDLDKDGQPDSYFEEVVPTVVQEVDPVERSDVSLVFRSRELSVAGGENNAITHKFQLYLGPKRAALLEPFQADTTMSFGWFAPISKAMVGLLSFFHNTLYLPYGFAIILLTVIVRGCMFPLSRKQVANVQKMKEINPKLQELKKKFGDDKEAMTRAQLELMRKHGYNPLSGCLPIFLQLPIFIGLYNGLNNAIDLRNAGFLWIDNLAAPDALFQLPFTVPFFGWTEFNLLPLLTIVLFIVQNKLFTPPPTNEEQALQFKMMNVMMAVIGVMFYKVPAGLCVYFIASSLWGIAERKLLDRHKRALEAAGVADASEVIAGRAAISEQKKEEVAKKEPGFLARLMEAADKAKHPTNGQSASAARKDRGGKKKGSKPRR
jgi:YidC/Oxa1 family membrane protein insertase